LGFLRNKIAGRAGKLIAAEIRKIVENATFSARNPAKILPIVAPSPQILDI